MQSQCQEKVSSSWKVDQNPSERPLDSRHHCHRLECAEGEGLLDQGLCTHLYHLMNQKMAMMVLLGSLLC
jgi:hypothetical protein